MAEWQGADGVKQKLVERIEQDPFGRLIYRGLVLAFFALCGWVYVSDRSENADRFAHLTQRQGEIQATVDHQNTALALAGQSIDSVSRSLLAEHDRIDRADTRIDDLIQRMETMNTAITRLQDRRGGN